MRGETYAERALARACAAVSGAGEGSRNNTLNAEAFSIGQLVGAGRITYAEAERALLAAAAASGLDDGEAKYCVMRGLLHGQKRPRYEQAAPPPQHHKSTPPPRPYSDKTTSEPRFVGTRFEAMNKPQGQPIDLSPAEVRALLAKPRRMPDRMLDAGMWSLASFDGGKRSKDTFQHANGLVLDIDGGLASLDDHRDILIGTCWAAHTTKRSTADDPRWRVLIPLNRAVSADEYAWLLRWAAARLPGNLDAVQSDHAKGYILPLQTADYQYEVADGAPLDVDATVASVPYWEGYAQLHPMGIDHLVSEATSAVYRRQNGLERPISLPSVFWDLQENLHGGLWPGLTMLVGGTGSGKSQVALQMALHAAQRDDASVLYVSLELDTAALVCRLVGMLSGVHWANLYYGNQQCHGDNGLQACATAVLAEHGESLRRFDGLHIEGANPLTWQAENLHERCKQLRRMRPDKPLLVVLDYLQLVGDGQGDERRDLRERIGHAAYVGRACAVEYGAAVLMLSSTARGNYGMVAGDIDTSKVQPASLVGLGKESGETEFAADTLLVLCKQYGQETINLALAKHRAGPSAWCGPYTFDGLRFARKNMASGDRVPAGELPPPKENPGW